MSEEIKKGTATPQATAVPQQTAEQSVIGLVDNIANAIKEKSKKPMSHKTKKYVGQTPNLDETKSKMFLSIRKSLVLFMSDTEMINFKARTFTTDRNDIVKFIREHPSFGVEIFEDKYPEHIAKAFIENDKYITHDKKEYDSGSYT